MSNARKPDLSSPLRVIGARVNNLKNIDLMIVPYF